MTATATNLPTRTVNGVDPNRVMALAGQIQQDPDYGRFQFRASNRWLDGSRNRSAIQDFYAGKEERHERDEALVVEADQPDFLGGTNVAPNPVEHLLHALGSCLTNTLVYHASVQGIVLDSVETEVRGDLDARGFFGLSDEVRRGYEGIRVTMRVGSEADEAQLTTLAMHSPVYEMVSRSTPMEFVLEKVADT